MISVDVITKHTMNERSSDDGYLSTEQSRVKVMATVMLYDDVSHQWIFSNSCSSPSKVHIYQHVANNSFRVVGRSVEDRQVTINCVISRNLRYNQATPVFHQWRDNRQSIYGLQFLNKEEADSFADVMIASLELLNLAADQKLYHLHHAQQDHQHQQQQSHLQQQQQTMTTQRCRHDQQYGGREQPGAEEVGQPNMNQNHSENAYPNHHRQQQQEAQSSPLPSSQTIPFTSSPRVNRSPLLKTPFAVRASSTGTESNPVTGNSSLGLPVPTEAITPSSAPPPPPPPPPPAAPLDSQPPPARPSGIDLASALKGVKLRETTKSNESESKETKASSLQTMTLGRATKVVPVFPPGSGTTTIGRASGGPPPATRPKLNVMSEMEKKLKERKEKSEGGTIATDQQMPRRGAAGLQDLFQANQPQQRTGIAILAAFEEELSLQSLSSADNNVTVQRTPEVKATQAGVTPSAVNSHGNSSRSILPAELEAVKVELVAKITQELENTKHEIINAIRRELTKSFS